MFNSHMGWHRHRTISILEGSSIGQCAINVYKTELIFHVDMYLLICFILPLGWAYIILNPPETSTALCF